MARFNLRQAQVWRDQIDQALNINWTNQYGDWFDANYTAQGNVPFASAVVADTSIAREITLDITSMAQNWFAEPDRSTFMFLLGAQSGNILIETLAAVTPSQRPRISYNGGADLEATDCVVLNSAGAGGSTASPQNINGSIANPPWTRVIIEFPEPTVAVTSATLKFWSADQFSEQNVQVYQGRAPGEVAPPPATVPDAPSDLVFSNVTDTTTTVTVSPPATGSAPTGYKLERRIPPAAFVEIGSQAGNVFALTGLTAATVYEYRPRAFNAIGNGAYGTAETQATDNPATGGGGEITLNPTAPTITSNGGGASASVSVQESVTAVTTVTVTGSAPITYTLSGADAASFLISSGGVLSFASAPVFGQASKTVTVTATNASGSDAQTITVTVTPLLVAGTLSASQLEGVSRRIKWATVAKGLIDKQATESAWLVINTREHRVSQYESVIGTPTVSITQTSGPVVSLTQADVFQYQNWVGVRVSGGALAAKHNVAITYSTDSGQTFVDHIEVTGEVA